MRELQQFVIDMADAINHVKCTERQREVGKAWIRAAIQHAREKAQERSK